MQQYIHNENINIFVDKDKLQTILNNSEKASQFNRFRTLIEHGLDQLPFPGSGRTLERWKTLAKIGSTNLSLAKLYEAHTDALAITAELEAPLRCEGQAWAVWCAEPPNMRVCAHGDFRNLSIGNGIEVKLTGTKPWCSGASVVDNALVSCWLPDGRRCLVALAMNQSTIAINSSKWNAVGMADSSSAEVSFEETAGILVGSPGSYLTRPGFIHGGGGVAACWYGAAKRIASYLHQTTIATKEDSYRLVHLGAIDVALSSAAALLTEAAHQIDLRPTEQCTLEVTRARLAVEDAVNEVLRRVPRALGPGPLCTDKDLAQLIADLPIFVRQSHAEHDQAALGRLIVKERPDPWTL